MKRTKVKKDEKMFSTGKDDRQLVQAMIYFMKIKIIYNNQSVLQLRIGQKCGHTVEYYSAIRKD